MVYRVCLLRHGESDWNNKNLFTGWTDVELTTQGCNQARRAGNLLRAHNYPLDLAYTSVLKRALCTLHLVLEQMDMLYLPDVKSWRLNERHYGALQGLNKADTARKYGEDQVHLWRRSYDIRPPELAEDDLRHPAHDPRYQTALNSNDSLYLPATESLEDCVARTLPFWHDTVVPAIKAGKSVIIAAHGNSLRGIVKHLDSVSDQDIVGVEIPVGTPLIYELDEVTLLSRRHYYLGEPQVIGDKELLVAASSWGLMTRASAGLASWINDLQSVGLIKSDGIVQALTDPPTPVKDKLKIKSIQPVEDVQTLLKQSRFIAVDMSLWAEDASALLQQTLKMLKPGLDHNVHTLLLVTEQSPHAHASNDTSSTNTPVRGASSTSYNPADKVAEQVTEQLKAHGLLEGSKVLMVALPAPELNTVETSLQAAQHALDSGNALTATHTAAAAHAATPSPAASGVAPVASPRSTPPPTRNAATVKPLSAHSAEDVRRVVLMLQYTGRAVSAPVLVSAPHV